MSRGGSGEADGGGGIGNGDGGGGVVPPGPKLIPGPGRMGSMPRSRRRRAPTTASSTPSAPPGGSRSTPSSRTRDDRELVAGFLAQHETDDFEEYAGKPPRAVVAVFDEHGDLGMFGGAAAAGEAFRYMALQDQASRADLLEAIEAFHIAATITGVPGTVARGIRRLNEPGEMPAVEAPPGSLPRRRRSLRPLAPDGSGQYPNWIYIDNNSKDQMIGYVFALGAFWDAVAEDPAIDDPVRQQIQADARALADSLMTPVQVNPLQSADLVVRDWHQCPTRTSTSIRASCRSAASRPSCCRPAPATRTAGTRWPRSGWCGRSIHITGDAALGDYYYDELIGRRDFPRLMVSGPVHVGAMYQDGGAGGDTNFSNVNMAFVSAWGVLRYETDPDLRAKFHAVFASELWDADHPHDGESIGQAFFDLLRSGLGGDDPGRDRRRRRAARRVRHPALLRRRGRELRRRRAVGRLVPRHRRRHRDHADRAGQRQVAHPAAQAPAPAVELRVAQRPALGQRRRRREARSRRRPPLDLLDGADPARHARPGRQPLAARALS